MNTLLEMFQQQDGGASGGRLFRFIILMAILVPDVWIAMKTGTELKLDAYSVAAIMAVAAWHNRDKKIETTAQTTATMTATTAPTPHP